MHAFTSTLTAIALFIHAWLGCCWHHAHEQCAATQDEVASCCGHEHASCHDEGDESVPTEQPVCDEGACTFVRGETAIHLDLDSTTLADLQIASTDDAVSSGDRRMGAELRTPHDRPPPLRTHLLFQVLVI